MTATNSIFQASPNTRRKTVMCSVFLLACLFADTQVSAADTNYFSTAGSTNWICPAGVTSVVVECWGGGGAGGSAAVISGNTPQYGGGGAGGAYARYNLYAVVPGRTYYINVGAGGFNNFLVNDTRVPGGDSWFNSTNAPSATIIAKGGAGGESAIGSTTATGYGLSGAGTAAGSAGNVVYAGGSGAAGALNRAGGGGSSAGTNSAGIAATSNAGATAPAGGGNGGTGPTTNEAAGGAGFAPGGGGSGARSGSNIIRAGGRGGAGQVVLTFVPNIVPTVNLTAPTNGAGFFAPASIVLTADASDADGVITTVGFYNGSTFLGSDTSSPYTYTWMNVTAGSYSLTARATDNFGATSTSAVALITVEDVRYPLTVNSGSGSGLYTNRQLVAIAADTLSGKAFERWIGDTQYVNNVTYTNAVVTMSTNPVTLTATYKDVYPLTVNSGSGSGSYTNGQKVAISANIPAFGKFFVRWTGDIQYVNNVNYTNAVVTMSTNPATLTATYADITYALTVNSGTGDGLYTNGARVTITATNVPEMAFDRWAGDTQVVAGVFSLSTIVTMPANPVSLTATFKDASNGVMNVNWALSGGLFFSADPNTGILGPFGSGKSTVAQLMYSPDSVKDSILRSGAGAVNDVVLDTITLTENGDGIIEWGSFSNSTVRAWTNGYVYALIFQDDNVQPGDWYFSTTNNPLLALEKIATNMSPQFIEMSVDFDIGDAIDGKYGAQVIEAFALTVNDGSGSGLYTNGHVQAISANNAPAPWMTFDKWAGDTQSVNNVTYTNALVTMSTNPVTLTATYKNLPGLYTLTVSNGTGSGGYTNGAKVNISANAPAAGSTFKSWAGDIQYVNNVTYTNAVVTMSTNPVTLIAKYASALTVLGGSGSGSYTDGQQVPITADAPPDGKTFSQWTGSGTQYVANVTASNTTVTMPTQAITVRATFKDITYDLTVNSGSGSGSYASGTQVAIAPGDLRAGVTFKQWAGDTQIVNDVTYTNALVTMPASPATLTATYYYDLTVNSGTGDGNYTNGAQVEITADAPPTGQTFDRWTGDTQVVNNVTYTNALVTLSTNPATLSATYKNLPGWYTLTVNSGDGDGPYTNTQVVAITADAPESGKIFDRWTGDTQVVDSVSSVSATVTMPAQAVTLTATYTDAYYALTVNSGTGDGSFTNGTQVAILAAAPESGKIFDRWTGDTQVVDSVSSVSATVTMPAQAVTLTATYTDFAYTLTVNNGTGGGSYSNGAQVVITATAPEGTAFDRWTGDTQYVAGVLSLSTIVTMPASNITLTASCVDVSNGVASVEWAATAGFYFNADPNVGILGDGTGNKTITQLMYSPDDVKDDIFPGGAGAVNDVAWSQIIISEDGVANDGEIFDSYAYFAAQNCTRAFTNGYVYALIFQDSDVQAGDWYYSTPMLAIDTNTSPQSIEMNTDTFFGDPVDGPNGAQVIEGIVLTVINGSGSGTYIDGQQVAISANTPATGQTFDRWTGDTQVVNNVFYTNALVTLSAGPVTLTATYKNLPGFYTLTVTGGSGDGLYTNGQQVAIAADAPAPGQVFSQWAGDSVYVDNSNSASATVTMPAQSVAVTATYKSTEQYTTNGTPYSWLAGYGLTNYESDVVLDQDSDGLKTWQEYIAGTDPIDAASCLTAAQATLNTVTWIPVTGRVYSVHWSTDLVKGFTMKQDNIVHPQSSYTNVTPDTAINHYQVKVRLQ